MTNPQELRAGADLALGGRRPNHLLLVLPLSAGGVLAVLLLLVWVVPQLQRLNTDQQRLAAMEQQARRLPLLRAQLQQTMAAQERAEGQKRQLLALIAGSGSLQTFMAQVDREAQRHGVVLDVLQPQAPAPPPAANGKPAAAAKPAAGGAAAEAAAAPASGCPNLASEGLTTTRQSLAARGRYPNLLAFMRGLERLSLLVVQCDLVLEQPAPKPASNDPKAARPTIDPMLLRFELGLYQQGAAGTEGSAAAGASAGAATPAPAGAPAAP